MTWDGSGRASVWTRSAGGPWAAISSTSDPVMRWMAGRSASTRLRLNSGSSRRRSREWSGGSILMKVPGPGGCEVSRAGKPGVAKSELNRASPSTARASSYRVTSQTSLPSKSSRTRVMGRPACRSRYSDGGSNGHVLGMG
ncbi:hypothetical protein ACNF49_44505 [Actinomadura sp. ATCC 39365]